MAYIGNIGSLLNSVYVRDKSPTKRRTQAKLSKRGKNISKFTYVNPVISPVKVLKHPAPTIGDRLKQIKDRYNEEVKLHGEQTCIREGFVYLVSNKAYPGWIKVGMTIDFENRLTQYNVYDPNNGFEMHTIKWVYDRRHIETLLLSAINDKATSRKGEWFYISKEQAIDVFTAT